MDNELEVRLKAMEMALITVIMTIEDINAPLIRDRLAHTRERISTTYTDPHTNKLVLEYFDKFT